MYKYTFTSTVQDLLDAEEAERTARTFRAPFRWIMIAFGIAWLIAGLLAVDWSNLTLRPIFWLLLGLCIVYYFVIRPYGRRRRIKARNAKHQDIVVELSRDHIKIEVSDVGNFTRSWEELVEFIETKRGLIFCFSDNVVNWMPVRVFPNEEKKNNLVGFVKNQINNVSS